MRILAIVLAVTGMACSSSGDDAGEPMPDGGPRWNICIEACDWLGEIECTGLRPDDDSAKPCFEECHEQNEVWPNSYPATCVSEANDCDEAKTCFE